MTVPDSTELPALIRNAFDALPGPDDERLGDIEQNLSRYQVQKRVPYRQYRMSWILWLILLLGGTATAAWWFGVSERDDKGQAAPITEQSLPIDRSERENKKDTGQDSEHEQVKRHSPIIYQRGH